MGENGEESGAGFETVEEHQKEEGEINDAASVDDNAAAAKEDKKTSDAILDELFSTIREAGTAIDVAEAITEVSRSRKERATREASRSRSRSHERKHKHKKNKKEKKHKKHRSRSRSNDRKRRHRSTSSSPTRIGKTGTLADIKINTKTKAIDDLVKAAPISAVSNPDEEDDLPMGADYRTVMAESVAASEPSTSQGPPLPPDLPSEKKIHPSFPLKKSDGEKKEMEEKGSPMLKKVISEKGGALLIPRKIQIEVTKNNGGSADTFGPAAPPAVGEKKEEEEEESEITPIQTKEKGKITFGQISLKLNNGGEKKEEEKKEEEEKEEEMKREEESESEEEKEEGKKEERKEGKKENREEKEKKAAKKLANRRRRSSSTEVARKKEKKERRRSRSKSRDRRERDRSRDNGRDRRRDGSRSREERGRDRRDERRRRSRSRSGDRRRDERDRDRRVRGSSRSRERRRSRSRERSKSREKIDKKKLLEIALQNSRGGAGATVSEKQGVNMKILEKAGGRNIGDIVSYCQKLSETEKDEKVGGRGRDSDDDDFSYRKREIKLNIPGSKQLPTSTPQERLLDTAPLRAAFPVSSGAIHRENTEAKPSEWKKVEASALVPSVCTAVQKKLVATNSLTKIKAESEGKFIPPSAFPILPPPPVPPKLRGDLIPPPPPPPNLSASSLMPPPPMPPTIITPSTDRLIHMPESHYDQDSRSVRRTMDERAKAVDRLVRNPNDTDAMKRLSEIDDALNNYGKSAELSGRWMGHTKVNLLTGDELQPHDPRYHAWVKKDLFKNTAPVVGGVGMQLMKKMGWNPGEGLGRERQGDTQPLLLEVKSDRKGLYSEGYDAPLPKSKSKGSKGKGGGGGGGGGGAPVEEKNPISAIMEWTQRRKWEPPVWEFNATGGMNKQFTCTVKLNGFEFIGPVCLNKKAAKTECAKVALEKIGFAAPNMQTPTVYNPNNNISIPEQIVEAQVRSAIEAAALSAMPPPPSYVAPLEMSTVQPDKYDPAKIQEMAMEREKAAAEAEKAAAEKAAAAAAAPPPPPPPPTNQGGRGRGRGRGGGGMGRGGHQYPPHHVGYGHPGYYPPPPPPNGWMGEDFTQDPTGNSAPYGEYPPVPPPGHPYSSFPSNQWMPDDEFGGFHPPPPPFRGPRAHSPAYEPYGNRGRGYY